MDETHGAKWSAENLWLVLCWTGEQSLQNTSGEEIGIKENLEDTIPIDIRIDFCSLINKKMLHPSLTPNRYRLQVERG